MSLYGSTNDTHTLMTQGFSTMLQSQMAMIQSMLDEQTIMIHAVMALIRGASATRTVLHNQQGEPVGVQTH